MYLCEKCNSEHNGSYGSSRFCSPKCARSFSSNTNRQKTNKKVSENLKGWKTIKGGRIRRNCEFGCGQQAKFFLKSVKKWCCSASANQCPKIRERNSKSLKRVYKNGIRSKNFPNSDILQKSHEAFRRKLKEQYNKLPFEEKPPAEQRRIVLDKQNRRCLCGINEWNGKPLKLHLDHIDGNRKNSKRKNLRFLCPNCHSQTKTYCKGQNKNFSDEEIREALVKNNFKISTALDELGLVPGGYNWERTKKISLEMLSH